MHTDDQKLIMEAIALTKKSNSIEYARTVAEKIINDSWSDIEKLLPDNQHKNTLKLFSQYLTARKI
jgi:geranylgeranyl pyrophosphate synthase